MGSLLSDDLGMKEQIATPLYSELDHSVQGMCNTECCKTYPMLCRNKVQLVDVELKHVKLHRLWKKPFKTL